MKSKVLVVEVGIFLLVLDVFLVIDRQNKVGKYYGDLSIEREVFTDQKYLLRKNILCIWGKRIKLVDFGMFFCILAQEEEVFVFYYIIKCKKI